MDTTDTPRHKVFHLRFTKALQERIDDARALVARESGIEISEAHFIRALVNDGLKYRLKKYPRVKIKLDRRKSS